MMVQSFHDRNGNHFAPCILRGRNRFAPFRNLLPNPLMRSCLVEVGDIGMEDAVELLVTEDQHMVQAFLSDTPQATFADGIGSGCMIRCFENLNRIGGRHASKARPKFVIVITNQVLRRVPIRGGFTELLCDPSIGWGSSHAYGDHFLRLQEGEEEGKERSKEQIGDL